jgi:hypothetical protein
VLFKTEDERWANHPRRLCDGVNFPTCRGSRTENDAFVLFGL